MKKTILVLCLIAGALAARGQQVISGSQLDDFTAISLTGNMSVELVQADTLGVYMELGGMDAKQITWGTAGGTLSIKARATQKDASLKIKISCRNIERLTSNGADVFFVTPLRARMFTAEISSGAKLTATADCFDFVLRLTGNSAAMLDGASRYAAITANQRSKVDARNMEATSLEVYAYMGSEVYTWGTERIVAETNTSGAIFYRGDPVVMRVSNKFGGNINNIGK